MSDLDFLPKLYPSIPSPRQSDSTSEQGLADFASVEEFEDELFRHAVEICRIICPQYWNANRNLFSVSSKTPEDLAQYILESAWIKRYQQLVHSDPHQFTIGSFRKRFYVSASRVCSIQNRHHRALCRHDEEHWVVELTETEPGKDGLDLTVTDNLSPTANRLLLLSSFNINEANPLQKASDVLSPYLGDAAIQAAVSELTTIRTTAPMNQQLRQQLDKEWRQVTSQIKSAEPLTAIVRDRLLQRMVTAEDRAALKLLKAEFIQSYLPLALTEVLKLGVDAWKPASLIRRLVNEFGKVLDTWLETFTAYAESQSEASAWKDEEGETSEAFEVDIRDRFSRITGEKPTGELAFALLREATKRVVHTPGVDDTVKMNNADDIRDLVVKAKATGALRQKTPQELSIDLLTDFFNSLPASQHEEAYLNLIEQLGPNPSGEVRKTRLKNLSRYSRGLLLADYRVLSEFLDLPINHAASPVIILKAANDKMRQMPGLEIPVYVKEVLDAIRVAVMEDPTKVSLAEIPAIAPISQDDSEATSSGGSRVMTVRNLSVNRTANIIEVYPVEGSATQLFEDLQNYPVWHSWLDGMGLQASCIPKGSGGKILLEGEWVDNLSTNDIRQALMGVIHCLRNVGTEQTMITFKVGSPEVSSTRPPVQEDAVSPTVRRCACGCNEVLKRPRTLYKQGHNMKPAAVSK